jgi:hypothetical protein
MISVPRSSPMNNDRLGSLIASIGSEVEGQAGFWQFNFGEVRLICVTDETHDRMRVMSPIASVDELNSEHILACMNANFDRALDARYCISNETLWGAFIHPLGCLTDGLFHSACSQVSEVAVNFGGSYTSGGLSFNSDIFE